jgi:hypothetical protein
MHAGSFEQCERKLRSGPLLGRPGRWRWRWPSRRLAAAKCDDHRDAETGHDDACERTAAHMNAPQARERPYLPWFQTSETAAEDGIPVYPLAISPIPSCACSCKGPSVRRLGGSRRRRVCSTPACKELRWRGRDEVLVPPEGVTRIASARATPLDSPRRQRFAAAANTRLTSGHRSGLMSSPSFTWLPHHLRLSAWSS